MANNISNMLNSRLRFSGLSSGFDTDTMIKQLMQVERAKVDRVKQNRTLLEWKRDDYRSISNSIRNFKDEFFDSIKPTTNFRSSSAFAMFDTKSDNESIATVTAGAGAVSTTHKLYVKNLATAASITSAAAVTGKVDGSVAISDFTLQGKQIDITLDGVKKTINLEDYSNIGDLQSKLQNAIDAAFGKTNTDTSKLNVLINVDKLEFKAALAGSTFSISDTPNSYLSTLGFTSAQQNFITGSDISAADRGTLNGKFKIKLGADEKEIDLSSITTANTLDDIRVMIQSKLDDAVNGFGSDKIAVTLNGGKLEFLTKTGERLTLSNGSSNSNLSKLGFTSGTSTTATSSADINLTGNEKGKTFTVNVDGIDTTIEIDNDYSDLASMAAFIQTKFTGVSVSTSGNKLVFGSATGQKIIFKNGPEDSLSKLGYTASDNVSNRVSFTKSLDSIENHFAIPAALDGTANVQFTINGTNINLGKTFAQATINDVMTAINSSSAGVEMKYNSLEDKFSLTSKLTGASETIGFTDTNGLFASLGIQQANLKAGEDAVFDLDNVTNMQRSTNDFNVDGVTYSLKSDASPGTEVHITVNGNTTDLVGKIKSFVSKYNEVVDKINGELVEKYDRDYAPLTDDQRETMSEDDIKKWEEKAKAGLLRSDSLLSNITLNMRKALSDPITGASLSLAKIGITTGSYEMKGKLIIDETKLATAIKDNPDGVTKLFTQESQYSYTDGLEDSSKRKTRYEESGVAQRLYDIIQDNIRTTRDTNGKKGILLEKAGITGDITEFSNQMNKSMLEQDTLISTLLDRLSDKENALYSKFTAMEKALSDMKSQSSWIGQQLGGQQ